MTPKPLKREKQVWIIFTAWVLANTTTYLLFGNIGTLVSNLVIGIPLIVIAFRRLK